MQLFFLEIIFPTGLAFLELEKLGLIVPEKERYKTTQSKIKVEFLALEILNRCY